MAVRFGLVGTGYWARTVHGAGLAAHPGVELAGVWGRDPSRTADAAAELGTAPVPTFEQLLDEVDAVAFAVPPTVQAPLALRAAGSGRHLLLDKPTALDPGEARELADAAEQSGVGSVVFFTSMFDLGRRDWAAGVRAAGDWDGAIGFWMGSLDTPGSPYANSPWRREQGSLWDSLPHAVSLLEATLGTIGAVTARGGHRDTVHLITEHPGGATGTVTGSLLTPEGARRSSFDVWGPRGTSSVPDSGDSSTAYRVAIDELLTQVDRAKPGHPYDVRYGAHVVDLLAAAQRQVEAARRPR